jgi:chaperonin GroEL
MIYKEMVNKSDFESPKMKGMKKIADMVKRTLGPGGLPILIARVGQALDGTPLGPKITKDGVSVADECSSPIPEEDVVIQAVKAICKKTADVAGDGTTTAIVLGEAIMIEMNAQMNADPSLNPQLVKQSVEQASKKVIEQLKLIATPVKSSKMIKEVATISANGDEEIGEIIAQAFDKVGAEGVVTVDEGSGTGLTLTVVDGYQINKGAQSRNAFFNNKQQTQFEAENTAVIVVDSKLLNYTDVLPTLNILAGVVNGKPTKKLPPFIIVANEFSNEVLQFFNIQKNELGMQVCLVEGPNVTHVRSSYCEDLAVFTGGKKLGGSNRSLAAIEPTDIGFAGRVISDKYKTTFYNGNGPEEEILNRVDQLKALKQQAESPYDAQIINDRIASLTNGIAKIGVGGNTELEVKEKYDRIEDALNAARAAIEEGVVPGGGTTLCRISNTLSIDSIGERILWGALKYPLIQILANIGVEVSKELGTQIATTPNSVFDAKDKKLVDAFEAGIIDPVKVTRSALENAVSIAVLLSTAGGAIVYKNKSQDVTPQ